MHDYNNTMNENDPVAWRAWGSRENKKPKFESRNPKQDKRVIQC